MHISSLSQLLIHLGAGVWSITLYQSVSAWACSRLGDPLPRSTGRLTINPLRHLDPLGTFFVLFGGCGFGKPMEHNNMFIKNPRKNILLSILLPVFTCISVGILTGILIGLLAPGWFLPLRPLYRFPMTMALFNLIPIHPLDGARLLRQYLSPHAVVIFTQYEKIMLLVLCLLILINVIPSILNSITGVIIRICILPALRWFLI